MSSFTSSQSFVQRTFPPLIGSLTSPSVEQICQKNHVSFAELLRPFCNVYVDHQLKDPSGNDLPIKHLKVGVQDVKELPPSHAVARRLLNEAVAGAWCDVTKEVRSGDGEHSLVVDIPAECSWFHAWTETFLQVQFPSEHEFTRHLLGCMLVTSTEDPPETMQTLLESLREMQTPAPARLPKWFCPAIFKFYILLHDARKGDKAAALSFFDSIEKAYGPDHCFFLEVNSRQQGENGVVNYWTDCIPRAMGAPDQFSKSDGQQMKQSSTPSEHPLHEHPLSPHLDNHYSIPGVSSNSFGEEVEIEAVGAFTECGGCLSSKDVDSLRELMGCVVRNALLPHVEKQIYILNDLVANKKGMSRSLLSATKRLFGSPRPGGTGGQAGQVIPPDAPELQLRRLGDLYFIFSSYSNAFQAYYAAKRELGMDQAWLHYAGALEMASLSAFMLPEPSKKAVEYMEEAILTYLNSCQLQQFATRATLLSYHCLKDREMYAEAAKQLIRMTSEESDLRSALLLEQAAYCVLRDAKPRKYAFQMVLAGHRYTKAGQKRHALRCVRQALQVYGGRGWGLAEDHIHWTIGRLAGQLYQQGGPGADAQLLGEGLRALSQLLHSRSRQAATQQATYLLEYLNMHQSWNREDRGQKLAFLPLPVVEDNSASVRVVAAAPGGSRLDVFQADSPDEAVLWARMEELGLAETVGGAPMIFRPTVPVLSKASLNTQGHVLAVNERLEVQIALRNPLQISLPLARLRLLWTWTGASGRVVEGGEDQTSTENEEAVAFTEELPSLLLPPQALHLVTLSVVPRCEGSLSITGLACSLTTAVGVPGATADQIPPVVRGRQDLVVRGPKLKPPKDRPFADCYADDRRLYASVVPAEPLLTVTGIPSNMEMVCGQMELMQLELCNAGNMALTSLYAVSDAAGLLALPPELVMAPKTIDDVESKSQFQVTSVNLTSCGGILRPGVRLPLSLWLRAPDVRGPVQLHLLLLYAGGSPEEVPRYRVLRATLRLVVVDGVQLSAVATRSPQGGETGSFYVSASNQHSAPAVLRGLVLASSHWTLEPPALCPADMTLQPTESLFLVSRARAYLVEEKECAISSVKLGADCSLSSGASNLLLRHAACQLMALGLIWETTVGGHTTQGLSILDVGTMGVAARGAASALIPDLADPSRVPHTVTIFGPDREEARPTLDSGEATSVWLSLSHPDNVSHSFSNNRVCLVDVAVTIASSCARELTVHVNAAGTKDTAIRPAVLRSHVYTPHAAGAFAWAGRARACLTVPPRGCVVITLRAAVAKPGTYDLAVRLSAAVCDVRGLKPLPPPPESPLVVTDSDINAR